MEPPLERFDQIANIIWFDNGQAFAQQFLLVSGKPSHETDFKIFSFWSAKDFLQCVRLGVSVYSILRWVRFELLYFHQKLVSNIVFTLIRWFTTSIPGLQYSLGCPHLYFETKQTIRLLLCTWWINFLWKLNSNADTYRRKITRKNYSIESLPGNWTWI